MTVSIDSQCFAVIQLDWNVKYRNNRQSETGRLTVLYHGGLMEDCNVSRPRIPSRLAYSGGQEVSGKIRGEISQGRKEHQEVFPEEEFLR